MTPLAQLIEEAYSDDFATSKDYFSIIMSVMVLAVTDKNYQRPLLPIMMRITYELDIKDIKIVNELIAFSNVTVVNNEPTFNINQVNYTALDFVDQSDPDAELLQFVAKEFINKSER